MIIFRYLTREVMYTMLAVSSVLLLITMSGRFVKYLAQAAAGQLDADVLFSIMVFRLPGFLELVLPLGLFIGILLAYGRLYMESEMTVLSACGFSQGQLTRLTLIPAVLVAAFVALLALVVTPMGVDRTELILNEQKKRSEFDGLSPGRFMSLSRSGAVSYTENLSEDRKQMQQVFMAGQASSKGDVGVLKAKEGRQLDHPEFGQRYLVLNDGYRYEGKPGHQSYTVTKFDEQGQYLHVDDPGAIIPRKADRKTTVELMGSDATSDIATLHWRFSLPVLVIIVSLLAVPLSKTNPRQGRYVKMIPAILLYIIYLVSLNAARGMAEDGKVSVWLAIWGVHGIFLLIAALLLYWPDWIRKLSYKPDSQEADHVAA